MPKTASLPEWPVGRKYITIREMAELWIQHRSGGASAPHGQDRIGRPEGEQAAEGAVAVSGDYNEWMTGLAAQRASLEANEDADRKRAVTVAVEITSILAAAKRAGVHPFLPNDDTPIFAVPDGDFLLDEERFGKISSAIRGAVPSRDIVKSAGLDQSATAAAPGMRTAAETAPPKSESDLAKWIFAQHPTDGSAPASHDRLLARARKELSATFTKTRFTAAFRLVYESSSHRAPVTGWPLREPFAELARKSL